MAIDELELEHDGLLEMELGSDYIGSAYSPQVDVTATAAGHEVAITYDDAATGITTKTFDVADGEDGATGPAGRKAPKARKASKAPRATLAPQAAKAPRAIPEPLAHRARQARLARKAQQASAPPHPWAR